LNVSGTGALPITALLQRWRAGDSAAADELLPLVYAQLRGIARRQLAGERLAHTLMPTDLVHEAYLKLSEGALPDSTDRVHFFGIAARAMRQILVDHERHRRAGNVDLLALDEALHQLEKFDERKARVIELRAFAGLEFDEIARLLGISRATLMRDFRAARAWLYHALEMSPSDRLT
jgi:DNA-directed RNA polymerase specialized sigma24 family protein